MSHRRNRPDPDVDLDTTLDRDAELDELRDGGPARTPGRQTPTVVGSNPRDPATARHPRPGAAPTTTGDATTGGMNTPIGMGTSDANSTGQVGGAPSPDSDNRVSRRRRDDADGS
jgi:hypothetical protein